MPLARQPPLTSSAVRFRVDPRGVPAEKAARRLGITAAHFAEVLPSLHRRHFPRADPDTGNYDLKAIDAWLDAAAGLVTEPSASDAEAGFDDRLRAFREGKGPRARR